EVVLLEQQHFEPAAGGVARDADAVDAAADDGEIELGHFPGIRTQRSRISDRKIACSFVKFHLPDRRLPAPKGPWYPCVGPPSAPIAHTDRCSMDRREFGKLSLGTMVVA